MLVRIIHQAITDLLVRFVLVCRLDTDLWIPGDDNGFFGNKSRLFDCRRGMAIGTFDFLPDHRFIHRDGRVANTAANMKSVGIWFFCERRIPGGSVIDRLKLVFIIVVVRWRRVFRRRAARWSDGLSWMDRRSRTGWVGAV